MGMKKEISMKISLRFTVIMHPFSPFSPSSVAILSTFRYLKSRNKQLCSTAISLICEWLTACAIVLSLFLSFDFAQIFFVVCPHCSGTNLFNGSLINVVLLQFNGVFHWAHMICHCVCACVRCTRCSLALYFVLYALRMHFFSLEKAERGRKRCRIIRVLILHTCLLSCAFSLFSITLFHLRILSCDAAHLFDMRSYYVA